jgi:stringent starvation protein B
MLSNRPYLLRAFHQWITDSACTPILVIDANHPRCKIPQDYAEGGEIVFNISPSAIRDLKMTNEKVEFKASFSGVIHIISAPINAILAIYAEENGEGIFFDAEENADSVDTDAGMPRGVAQLTSIEGSTSESALASQVVSTGASEKGRPVLRLVE